jgi:hypothetical protein
MAVTLLVMLNMDFIVTMVILSSSMTSATKFVEMAKTYRIGGAMMAILNQVMGAHQSVMLREVTAAQVVIQLIQTYALRYAETK